MNDMVVGGVGKAKDNACATSAGVEFYRVVALRWLRSCAGKRVGPQLGGAPAECFSCVATDATMGDAFGNPRPFAYHAGEAIRRGG